MEYNKQLDTLYKSYKEEWKKAIAEGEISEELTEKLSCPLLLDSDAAGWGCEAKRKIMIIGQENRGWGHPGKNLTKFSEFIKREEAVAELQQTYEGFNFGADYIKSPFWQAYKKISSMPSGLTGS